MHMKEASCIDYETVSECLKKKKEKKKKET